MPGSKLYTIEYMEPVVKNDIPGLLTIASNMIKKAIEERLMINPVVFGKPLRYSLKGHRRLRVSDYRVIYRIEVEKSTVIILGIKHRKKIYEEF